MTSLEPHTANHYTHFLRRLDRVTEGHLELAMSLYGDHELLRLVLDRSELPEGAHRVAIALGPVHEGPYVVVTRHGHFVTCLAKYMRPKEMPIVRRAQLEAAAKDLERMRERLERVRRLEEEVDDARTIARLKAIDLGSTSLPREDFLELARWDALLGGETHHQFLANFAACQEALPKIVRIRANKRSAREDEVLRAWWGSFWTASNLHVLANIGDVYARCDAIGQASEGLVTLPVGLLSSFAAAQARPFVQHTARAIWSSLRHTSHVLDHLSSVERDEPFTRMLVDSTLTTIALGSRCGRSEALRQLRAPAAADPAFETEIAPLLRDALRDPEEALDAFTLYAQELVAAERGGDPRKVPADAARAIAVAGTSDWRVDPLARQGLARALPWLAAADASELFVPRAWCEPVTYSPLRAVSLARSLETHLHLERPQPVRRAPALERNERCACGSGQKYKRCCMRSVPLAA